MKRIIFLSVFISVFIFIYSCKSRNNQSDNNPLSSDIVKNPNSAEGSSDTSKLPKFQFVEEMHDFGKIAQGEKVEYSFKFKNVGKSDLVITDARVSCGCTIADYPKTAIAPNGEGSIDVKFNSEGKKGFQNKTVTIIANTQPNTKVLTIKAQVQVLEGENNNN